MVKIVLAKNKERVALIREELKKNQGYCPCSLIKNDDTECMCKEFREALKKGALGECHCGLYEIVEIQD